MNRVDLLFRQLKENNEGALICYLPIISDDPQQAMKIADIFFKAGVDLIELGFPSLRPWLDGNVIQNAHLNARNRRIDIEAAFSFAHQIRSKYPQWPIVPMTTYSEVIGYGIDRFIQRSQICEIDAVEIPDYPAFARGDVHNFRSKLKMVSIEFVSFTEGIAQISQTSREYRLFHHIVQSTNSFLFLMASPGVTGKRAVLAADFLKTAVCNIRQAQAEDNNAFPVVVGFGISNPEQVDQVIKEVGADGVVVGSAVSEMILAQNSQMKIGEFLVSLKQATKRKC